MDERERAEEAVLVLLAQRGDGDAFRRLVERYDRRLLYFLRRILEEAEESYDVLQGVWLKVHQSLHSLRSPQAFRVWLYRIAHDRAVSCLRRRRRSLPLDDAASGELVNDEATASMPDSAEAVHAALERLSVDHRRVLTLKYLEEMSIDEIAEVVGCSPGTVKSRLHYAKATLRRHIEESDHD